MTAAEVPEVVRAQLAISLDVDDAVAALRLAKELRPWFGVAKVGLELYSAAGPDIVGALTEMGFEVFADLKFHDIPTTVGRAARVVGALGASYLNFHAAGGTAMLAAGVEGLVAGAEGAGLPAPVALAVTVLTSEAEAPHELLMARVRAGIDGGCGGVVCAATDVAAVKAECADLVAVVPGIRPPGTPVDDQARMGTPAEAIAAGADILVIGRAVTATDDPAAAAAAIAASLSV